MKRGTKKKSVVKKAIVPSDFGVVLESMGSKIDQMLEGYGALDKKIDTHHGEFCEFRKEVNFKFDVVFEKFGEVDQRFEKVDQRFDKIDQRFEKMDQRFEKMDQRFEKIDQRFEKMDQKFDMVFDGVHLIRNDLKEKVSRDEFVLLEKRVLVLERKKVNN